MIYRVISAFFLGFYLFMIGAVAFLSYVIYIDVALAGYLKVILIGLAGTMTVIGIKEIFDILKYLRKISGQP